MFILGISAFYHDAAAAILHNGKVIAAAQEERFTRKKHDPSFPANAVAYCLKEAGISAEELEAVVFYDKPFLKFERLLESYYDYAPAGWRSFIASVPVWVKEKLFLKDMLKTEMSEIGTLSKNTKWLFPEHHLSHAASAFFPSPFSDAAILTIDGVGEWCTASIGYGNQNSIRVLSELNFPHSVGLLYSAFTYYLGFRVNSGEYKLMGLAPYGDPDAAETKHYINQIKNNMIELFEDGSVWLNQKYFNYATGLTMTRDKAWKELFGIERREPETEFNNRHANLAFAIQSVTEEIVLKMAATAQKLTGSENLVLSGGVALNCVANGRLLKSGLFKQIYAQPASGDAGGALGAALAVWHIHYQKPKEVSHRNVPLHGAYLGPEYSDAEIKNALDQKAAVYTHFRSEVELLEATADLLSKGFSAGWFQGRMEWGPRALGNRSIIADPRNPEMQKN